MNSRPLLGVHGILFLAVIPIQAKSPYRGILDVIIEARRHASEVLQPHALMSASAQGVARRLARHMAGELGNE